MAWNFSIIPRHIFLLLPIYYLQPQPKFPKKPPPFLQQQQISNKATGKQ